MTHIFQEVATAEHQAYISGQDLKVTKAMAERDIITEKGASLGKNADERDRNLIIGLHTHRPYQIALALHRANEQRLANAKAELELYKDARRQEEWSIRAALVDALNRRNLPSDPIDQGFDQAADDYGDALAEDAMGTYNGQTDQDNYLPF